MSSELDISNQEPVFDFHEETRYLAGGEGALNATEWSSQEPSELFQSTISVNETDQQLAPPRLTDQGSSIPYHNRDKPSDAASETQFTGLESDSALRFTENDARSHWSDPPADVVPSTLPTETPEIMDHKGPAEPQTFLTPLDFQDPPASIASCSPVKPDTSSCGLYGVPHNGTVQPSDYSKWEANHADLLEKRAEEEENLKKTLRTASREQLQAWYNSQDALLASTRERYLNNNKAVEQETRRAVAEQRDLSQAARVDWQKVWDMVHFQSPIRDTPAGASNKKSKPEIQKLSSESRAVGKGRDTSRLKALLEDLKNDQSATSERRCHAEDRNAAPAPLPVSYSPASQNLSNGAYEFC